MNEGTKRISDLQVFEDFIRAQAKLWSDDMRTNVGVRLVAIDGGIIRQAVAEGKTAELWRQLTDQLPSDATVVNFPSHGFFLQEIATSTAYADATCIRFVSEEWEPLEGPFPVYPPAFRPTINL